MKFVVLLCGIIEWWVKAWKWEYTQRIIWFRLTAYVHSDIKSFTVKHYIKYLFYNDPIYDLYTKKHLTDDRLILD